MSMGNETPSKLQRPEIPPPSDCCPDDETAPKAPNTPCRLQPPNQPRSGPESPSRLHSATPSKPPSSPSKLQSSPSKHSAAKSDLHAASTNTHSPVRSPIKGQSPPVLSSSKFFVHAADPVLQKQHAEAVATLSSITTDYKYLEEELTKKLNKVTELNQKLVTCEKMLRNMEEDRRKARDLQEREVAFYKGSLDELQRINIRLSLKMEANKASAEACLQEAETKYLTLLRSYKALQSNFELEQNLKALLVDQIEYLTKERDFLLQNTNTHDFLEPGSLRSDPIDILNNSDFADSLNSDFEASDFESGSNSDGSIRGTELMMSFQDMKPVDFESSSPIKSATIKQADISKAFSADKKDQILSPGKSFEVSRDFKFPAPTETSSFAGPAPPSPEQSAKANKRQSLPAKLKTNDKTDLVLFPIKLASQANLSSFDELPSIGADSTTHIKRHSASTGRRVSKPGHSRYNSHDIFPIRVEFEGEQNAELALSASAHPSELSSIARSRNPIKDSCDEAFMRLSGFGRVPPRDSATACSSKRSSVLSKQSSVWSDANILSSDITKQEITKLKFELQSLKLHNEKLLSYIGFELQKQKKNIKKLSSKQNLRGKGATKGIEYSDAKLIERLRDMLIHKKRVLRSVSINPQISRTMTKLDCVGLGAAAGGNEEDDSFAFKSHFINSIHDAKDFSNRGEFAVLDNQLMKKYKLQTFGMANPHYFSCEDSDVLAVESGEELDMGIDEVRTDGEWELSSDSGVVLDVEFNKLTRFNQMRYMIFGKEHMRKEKEIETIADEGLKYKFLTIALGIIVVAIQVTSRGQHQSSR